MAYLCPEPERPEKDRVRWWLQHAWSEKRLDALGVQQRIWYGKLMKDYKEAIRSDSRWQSWGLALAGGWHVLLHCLWFRLVRIPLDRTNIKLIKPNDPQLQALRHQINVLGNRFHVSPVVDVWSRWMIAMIGAGMLIVPLLALTYVPNKSYTQFMAVLFTIGFGMSFAHSHCSETSAFLMNSVKHMC